MLKYVVVIFLFLSFGFLYAQEPGSVFNSKAGLWARFKTTSVDNMWEVLKEKKLVQEGLVKNPYELSVDAWDDFAHEGPDVCALQFTSSEKKSYLLRSFESMDMAKNNNFLVTHEGTCGACSTLRDLYVYASKPDLAQEVRQCASRWFISDSNLKKCLMNEVGFTSWCADVWLFNILHTKEVCFETCIDEYGWFNVVMGRFPDSNNTVTGALRPCVRCDEENSGPGFKYAAGRNRRNSGIESGIQRPAKDISQLKHDHYFSVPQKRLHPLPQRPQMVP